MNFQNRFHNWEIKLLLAVTTGIGLAWLFEPTLPGSSWLLRLGLMTGCLAFTGGMFRLEAMQQSRNERAARRFIDTLCQIPPQELAELDTETMSLPLAKDNPWRPVFLRVRDSLVELANLADQSERQWSCAEVKSRRVEREAARIREVVDELTGPIIIVNDYDEALFANRRARELSLVAPEIADGKPSVEKLQRGPLRDLLAEMRKRKNSAPRSIELDLAGPSGAPLAFSAQARLLAGDGEQAERAALVVLHDIGGQRAAQKRHAEFVSAASHEMKTPLAGIRAYVEMLLDGDAEDDATHEEFLNVISTQAERLQRLVENLLNLARIEAGVVNVNKQSLSLNEILEATLNVVRPAAEAKQITLASDLSPLYLGVLVDRDLIAQAAINLLSNAVKYTPAGGQVTLRSRLDNDQCLFEVQDTGVGLSEEDCTKVFEKFYRVKKDQDMAPGTGLGLPLAKHIVTDVHGGLLTVTSAPGAGSTFRATLPMHRTHRH